MYLWNGIVDALSTVGKVAACSMRCQSDETREYDILRYRALHSGLLWLARLVNIMTDQIHHAALQMRRVMIST